MTQLSGTDKAREMLAAAYEDAGMYESLAIWRELGDSPFEEAALRAIEKALTLPSSPLVGEGLAVVPREVLELTQRKYKQQDGVATVLRRHTPKGLSGHDWDAREAFEQAIRLVERLSTILAAAPAPSPSSLREEIELGGSKYLRLDGPDAPIEEWKSVVIKGRRFVADSSSLREEMARQFRGVPTLLMQARYALRDFNVKQPGCGFDKLADGLNELVQIIEGPASSSPLREEMEAACRTCHGSGLLPGDSGWAGEDPTCISCNGTGKVAAIPASSSIGEEMVEAGARAMAAFEYERDTGKPMPANFDGPNYQWPDWSLEARACLVGALENAPIPGRKESIEAFRERSDAWLAGPYRRAMAVLERPPSPSSIGKTEELRKALEAKCGASYLHPMPSELRAGLLAALAPKPLPPTDDDDMSDESFAALQRHVEAQKPPNFRLTPIEPPNDDVRALVKRLRRYAEIQDASETRTIGRPATNTWAQGFRQAADTLEALSAQSSLPVEGEWDFVYRHSPPPADDPSFDDLAADIADSSLADEAPGVAANHRADELILHARAYLRGEDWLAHDSLVPERSPPPTADEVERVARAMYEDSPMRAISKTLAELANVPPDEPISWERSIEIGADHSGLRRLARAAIAAMPRQSPPLNMGEVRGFDAAIAAIEAWADGFIQPSDTANRLRATARDLRRNRDTILATPSLPEGMVEALQFYANEWEQAVEEVRTEAGSTGSIGELEPTNEMLLDGGARARRALATSPSSDLIGGEGDE